MNKANKIKGEIIELAIKSLKQCSKEKDLDKDSKRILFQALITKGIDKINFRIEDFGYIIGLNWSGFDGQFVCKYRLNYELGGEFRFDMGSYMVDILEDNL